MKFYELPPALAGGFFMIKKEKRLWPKIDFHKKKNN